MDITLLLQSSCIRHIDDTKLTDGGSDHTHHGDNKTDHPFPKLLIITYRCCNGVQEE